MSAPALGSAGLLEPVGLEELVERAALLTRVDRKYVLPLVAAERFVAELGRSARVLEIGGRRSAGYESLYLDTPGLTSYHLAARARRHRFKVRRRTYLDGGGSYLEVKTRDPRGRTVKERILCGATSELLDAEGVRFVEERLARSGAARVPGPLLRPALRTRYERTTLFLPADGSRVTVDTGLVWDRARDLPAGAALRLGPLAVVETKSGTSASPADRLLWSLGHRPARISKYGTGLAVLRPDLPSNRWRAVVNRHVRAVVPAA
ncbi:VTC domain-containing protein [Kineococcus sp. NUM-3379]